MNIRIFGAAIAAAALLVAAPSASAHVTVAADNLAAGGYSVLEVRLAHGCEGNATTKLEVKLPDGTTSFAPGRSAFWNGEVTMRKLDKPITGSHGEEISEVPDVATFTATKPLPDHVYDSIASSIKLPDEEGTIYFPIVQTCEKNTKTEWTQIPEEGADEPETPAASLTLTAAAGDEHGSAAAEEDDAHDESAKSDDSDSHEGMDDLEQDVDSARTLGIIGIVVGALGLLFGLFAIRRRK